MNSRSFNLYRDSSNSLTLSNVGELSWSWIPEKPHPSSEWERKFHSSLFTSSIKREIRHFLVVVVQWRQRNVQKSVMHVQSCCFANLNLLFFWSSRCRRRRRILRSLLRCNNADGNENVKKTIGFISKTTTLHVHHAFFVHFFARFCTTTTWTCLISRFVEYVNKQRRNFFSLSALEYGP